MKALLVVLAAMFAFGSTVTKATEIETTRWWAYQYCGSGEGQFQNMVILDRAQTFRRDFVVLNETSASVFQSLRDLVRASNWGDYPDFVFVRGQLSNGITDSTARTEMMTPIAACRWGEWLLDFPIRHEVENDQQ